MGAERQYTMPSLEQGGKIMTKPKSPFDWRGPCVIDWSQAGLTGNKFASKAPNNPKPVETPWRDKPMVENKPKAKK